MQKKLTFDCPSQTCHLNEVPHGRKTTRSDYSCGGLDTQIEDSSNDSVRSVSKRCVGERVIRFFEEAVALHDEEVIVKRNAFSSECSVGDRFELVPKFGPTLSSGSAEKFGVFLLSGFDVSIVVNDDFVRSPKDAFSERTSEN